MKATRLLIYLLLALPNLAGAQQLERHQAISAYVFNFAKNIKWKNENEIKNFKFVIISEDEAMKKEFKRLASLKTLRDKPITVQTPDEFVIPSNVHLIFLGKEFESHLIELINKIEGTNTLLITDSFTDRRFIMINLTSSSNLLHFEINKSNILNQGLEIDPSMILLGGTEVDVASIYRESVKNLLRMQSQIDTLLNSSKSLQEKIVSNEADIKKQNNLTTEQSRLIQLQKEELTDQELILRKLQNEVITNSAVLKTRATELNSKESKLKEQEFQIARATKILSTLNSSIDSLNRQVAAKEKALNVQDYTIESQNKLLMVLATAITLSVVMLFLLLRWYKQKNKLNQLLTIQANELEKANIQIMTTNEELIQTQEEIAAQRDVVAIQNKELEESKLIIENQNKEIKERNQNLEVEVENRTKELVEYNQQLEQFAFVSAHNLRAPVARILGLGHLLEMTEQKNDPEILGKLFLTTKELDRVVGDLNTILEVRKNNTATLTEIDLAQEIELIKTSLASEITLTQANLIIDLGEVKTIKTIRPYLDSILMNLIGNAIKYRHPRRKPEITIRTEVRKNFICLIVKDNGLGIDLNLYKDKIFKLSSRFHDHVEGKGFGLFLVKTQVVTMGGRMEVESTVNEGTTFYVYLKMP